MNMHKTMVTTLISAFSTQVYSVMQVRIWRNNLQNQKCAQISLERLAMVASSGSWNGRASHSQLWGQCSWQTHFAYVFHCGNFMYWASLAQHKRKKPHLRHRRYFVQQFYPLSCQGGREGSLQTVGKKIFISSGPGLQRCCLCNSPGYNAECTQQWQPEHAFMRQRRANSWNTDHMQRGAWVCVWMQTNTK